MVDLRTLQERTQAAKPDLSTKSSHYLVAILKNGIEREDARRQDQYLWLNCRADSLVTKNIHICALKVYEDHLIVFKAMAVTAEPPQRPSPLQTLLKSLKPEILELGVEEGVNMIDQLRAYMTANMEAELQLLFHDLLDSNGKISNEYVKEDTAAGIAYAEIRAVYPNKSRDDHLRSDIQSMLQEVTHVLGSSHEIEESDVSQFYKRL
ncbi:MAG: hypothetical protein Q9201_003638 [Fulgogasparrea decipioides]